MPLFINEYLQNLYGEKVYKLALDVGMTCPNRDGTKGVGGCIFCSEGGSGDFTFGDKELYSYTAQDIHHQIERAKSLLCKKSDCHKFIAYFQAFTNTYAPIEYLRELYFAAANHSDIVTVSIATRCDCISQEVIELLREVNRIKPVWVEMGLQSAHPQTLEFINCKYTYEEFTKSTGRLSAAGIDVIAHLILGLPGENHRMMEESVDKVCALPIKGLKLQLLHILKGTRLEEVYKENPFHIMSMDEYCELVVSLIRRIPEGIVIHRITGDGARRLLIEPKWSTDKKRVLNTINRLLKEK